MDQLGRYHVVVVADLRETSDHAAGVAEALDRWAAHGLTAGLFHLGGPATERVAPVACGIRMHLDRENAELVLFHEPTHVETAVVWMDNAVPSASLPPVSADRVVVVGEEPTRGSTRANGDALLFGQTPDWRPDPPTASALAGGRSPIAGRAQRARGDVEQTVLMVSSNGTGMGHLTRLLAYARKAPVGVRPHFFSLSQAVPVVREFDFPYEYAASVAANGMSPGRWRAYFTSRLAEVVDRLRPAVVVFDGAWAYESIADVKAQYPEVRWVWSRRGMWYRGMNRDQLAKEAWFDAVVEPGDFSFAADRGVTATAPASRVGPVTLLDNEELLAREDARQALGLDPSVPTALVTLGAGNINDTTSSVRVVIDALRSLGVEVCVTVPSIAQRAPTGETQVRAITTYPLGRYLRAFDVAVSAAGYNSFHELLRFGTPTLFLPNLDTALDDQRARAAYAADQGWALRLDRVDSSSQVREPLEVLLQHGHEMVAKVADVDPGNGAGQAMDLIAGLARKGE